MTRPASAGSERSGSGYTCRCVFDDGLVIGCAHDEAGVGVDADTINKNLYSLYKKKADMDVSAQIIKEMSTIVDNDNAMNRLLAYVRKLARSVNEKKQEEDITMHIANGLRQVKLAREGKMRLNTLDNLLDELDD